MFTRTTSMLKVFREMAGDRWLTGEIVKVSEDAYVFPFYSPSHREAIHCCEAKFKQGEALPFYCELKWSEMP